MKFTSIKIGVLALAIAQGAVTAFAEAEWAGLFPADVKTVGIAAPASVVSHKQLTNGVAQLRAAGYRVKVGPCADVREQAPAEQRAKELTDLWLDPEVDLILCARGGRGAEDVLPLLDWKRLKKRPMRVLGFSNITHLLNAMAAKGAGHPYSSTLLTSLQYQKPESRRRVRGMLDGAALEPVKLKALRAGACSGLPIGGHVTIFAKYMAGEGTVDPTGKVVFLECGGSKRPVTAVEEALKSLTDRGVFAKCAGVVLCNFTGCGTKKEVGDALKAWSKTVSCPVWRGYPYGHVPLSYGFDFQRRVSVDEKGVLRFEEPKAKQ